MRIIVNHLTRMQPGFVCLAGIDVRSGKHVRPVLDGKRLRASFLRAYGGVVDIGRLIDVGSVVPCGQPPEIEDHLFDSSNINFVADIAPHTFWHILQTVAQPSLPAIFGNALQQHGQGYVVGVNSGAGSLGCILITEPLHLYIDDYGKIRIAFNNPTYHVSLPVTDVRLYDHEHQPRPAVVMRLAQHLSSNMTTILSVGLTRKWKKETDNTEYHWLQVNNIFPANDPLLCLGTIGQ